MMSRLEWVHDLQLSPARHIPFLPAMCKSFTGRQAWRGEHPGNRALRSAKAHSILHNWVIALKLGLGPSPRRS
jgi:hypothetical protein